MYKLNMVEYFQWENFSALRHPQRGSDWAGFAAWNPLGEKECVSISLKSEVEEVAKGENWFQWQTSARVSFKNCIRFPVSWGKSERKCGRLPTPNSYPLSTDERLKCHRKHGMFSNLKRSRRRTFNEKSWKVEQNFYWNFPPQLWTELLSSKTKFPEAALKCAFVTQWDLISFQIFSTSLDSSSMAIVKPHFSSFNVLILPNSSTDSPSLDSCIVDFRLCRSFCAFFLSFYFTTTCHWNFH